MKSMKTTAHLLDAQACKFFAPKEIQPLLPRFEALLAAVMRADPDARAYMEQPLALFSTDKRFPILHLVCLLKDGQWRMFRGNPAIYQRKPGHRTVDESGQDGSRSMQPILRLEVVTDEKLTAAFDEKLARAVLKSGQSGQPGTVASELQELRAYTEMARQAQSPAVIFSAPVAMLLSSHAKPFLAQRFTLYQHIFGDGHEYPDDGLFYVGITARDWKTRWAEHLHAINTGSRLLFHREYRNRIASKRMTYVHHKVMGVAPTLERIQDLEEAFVRGHWEDARRLNMIPGGREGIKYMREHGMLSQGVRPMPEFAERMLLQWLQENPRKGLPAPWVSELWKDDEYALNVICGPEGRLSVDQVRQIRALAQQGDRPEVICQSVGARNVQQVHRVIKGATYTRVI